MKPVASIACLLSAGLISDPAYSVGPTYIDPTSFAGVLAAKGDAVWGVTDCTMAAGSYLVTCPSEQFNPATDVGKTFILDNALLDSASGGRAPLVGMIQAFGGTAASSTATLNVKATYAVGPNSHIADVDVVNPGSNFTFGSTQAVACTGGGGGCTSPGAQPIAEGMPAIMAVVSAGTSVPGSGGSPASGTCTVTGNSETSLPGQAPSITVSLTVMGGISSVVSVALGGNVVADTASNAGGIYTEGVIGCGGLSGGTLTLSYGVLLEQMLPRHGYYTAPPCSNMATASMASIGGAPGTGLMVTCADSFSSTAAWGTDNSASFQEAIRQSNLAAAGGTPTATASGLGPRCVYLPEGNYLTSPLYQPNASFSATSTMMGYGCWLGDERYHSNIFLVPNIQGDLFSWLDSGFAQSLPTLGYTQYVSNFKQPNRYNQAGSAVRNLAVIGDRSSSAAQNAFMFYGPTNYTLIDDVVVSYLRGAHWVLECRISMGAEISRSHVFETRGSTMMET